MPIPYANPQKIAIIFWWAGKAHVLAKDLVCMILSSVLVRELNYKKMSSEAWICAVQVWSGCNIEKVNHLWQCPKSGRLERGLLRKVHFLVGRESFEIQETLESPQSVEKQVESLSRDSKESRDFNHSRDPFSPGCGKFVFDGIPAMFGPHRDNFRRPILLYGMHVDSISSPQWHKQVGVCTYAWPWL